MCKNTEEEAVDKLIDLLYVPIDVTPYIGAGLGNKPIGKLTKEDFILPKVEEKIVLTTEAPKMKYCNACKVEHPINDFNRDITTRDGRRRICRSAQAEQTRAKKDKDRLARQEFGILLRFDKAGDSGKSLCEYLRHDAEVNRRSVENHIIFLLETIKAGSASKK